LSIGQVGEEPPLNAVCQNAQLDRGFLREIIGELLIKPGELAANLLDFNEEGKRSVVAKGPVDRLRGSLLPEVSFVFWETLARIRQVVAQHCKERANETLLGRLLVSANVIGKLTNTLYVRFNQFTRVYHRAVLHVM
jgi:hypothetical protein